MKKENIELDYDNVLDLKLIEKVGSPFEYTASILGTDKIAKDLKILVIRLESCAELYALNNSVTYVTDNKEKYDKFLTTVNHEKFGSDDSAILFNAWKNIDKLLEENNMKFDVCIMNPPYDGSLHLKILSKVIGYCDKVVNISPITWAAKHNRWKAAFQKYKNTNICRPADIEILDHRTSNDLFGLGNQIEKLAIYFYDKGVSHALDLAKYGFEKNEYSIFDKILSIKPGKLIWRNGINIVEPINHDISKKYICPVNVWHGGKTIADACIGTSNNIARGKIQFQAEFRTERELDNFNGFFKTKLLAWFHKNILIPSDNKIHMCMFVMSDYTHPWTDKDLCDYFGITGYISDTEAESGSEWETILNSFK